MDGKTLMKQNYETLLDLTIVDRVKIISLRNATLQIEKENEKVEYIDINIYKNLS